MKLVFVFQTDKLEFLFCIYMKTMAMICIVVKSVMICQLVVKTGLLTNQLMICVN